VNHPWNVHSTPFEDGLLGLDSEKALLSHPKPGASWEGFVAEQILASEPHDEAWFWATHQGAEVKRADAPRRA